MRKAWMLYRSNAPRQWLYESHGRHYLPDARLNGAMSLAARNGQRRVMLCREHLRMCPGSHQSRAYSDANGAQKQTTKRVAAGAKRGTY